MHSRKILFIEDDDTMAETICEYLAASDQRFIVRRAPNGSLGLKYTLLWKPNVILLDLGLPDISGQEVLRTVHKDSPLSKVCVVSGDDTLNTRLECFALGADDYVTKPYSLEELMARIIALCRRDMLKNDSHFISGTFTLEESGLVVARDGSVRLRAKEAALLKYLLQRPGRPISRSELLDTVWMGKDRFPNIVDATVESLRKKLGSIGCVNFVRTAYGSGYYFESVSPSLLNDEDLISDS